MKRRTLLRLVGRAGGTAAVLTTMKAMGLLQAQAHVQFPQLAPASGEGIRVAILGAGIAGMTAAYELAKAGYECRILEARDRPGGRCWTLRGGDTIQETDSIQTCRFDRSNDLYLNAGPARIPHHHRGILGYCKQFGVPLQVIVNDNRACYFHDDNAFDGQPIQGRRVLNDSQGYVSELLAKAISQSALNQDISTDDVERILLMVRSFGTLNTDLLYTGSSRAGYTVAPGAGAQPGELHPPLNFIELLKSDFWQYKMHFAEGYNQATTMLEPVGGMDHIAKAFAQQVSAMITTNAVVTQLRKTQLPNNSSGVRVVYQDSTSGDEAAWDADFAICTLPLSVLAGLDADFSPNYREAIATTDQSYVRAVKHAFQVRRRFWEEDDYIYGGISWTTRDITQMWYPATGFHQDTGIILGAYIWSNTIGDRIAALPIPQRLQAAIDDGTAIHPTYGQDVDFDRGVSIAWGKIPHSLGGWMGWDDTSRDTIYPILNQPDGPIYLAGEHMSYLTGWQEGSVLSAHDTVRKIAAVVQARAIN